MTVTLIGRSGCHLCEIADEVVEQVLADLPQDIADAVEVVERSVEDDPALHELWWDKIPVVLIDGRFHTQWRIAPDRLRTALDAAVRGEHAA